MRWIKRGKIFPAPGAPAWMGSHATVPTALPLGGSRYRVYFSSRDDLGRSQIGFVELDIRKPDEPLYITPEPVLKPGDLGTFDDSGAMPSWVTVVGARVFLYYIGWNLGVTVPFRNAIGLAVSEDGGRSFRRYSAGPVMDRGPDEPYFAASSCVLLESGVFRMWYLSCTAWAKVEGRPKHWYTIRYAESSDGIAWKRAPTPCLDYASDSEHAISRPSVLKDGSLYRMWYSHRGESYRIGYAESPDGRTWVRKDEEAGIDVSPTGWDSEMIEYPFVFDHGSRRFMLYNGNGYGRTGFGLAELSTD